MAIKKREYTNKALKAKAISADAAQQKNPCALTAEEGENLLRLLAESPAPLSPELKRAVANYKRIKAERIR